MFRYMFSILSALAVSGALLLPAQTLSAQDAERWTPTGWELSPFVGAFDDQPEYNPSGAAGFVDPASNVFFGGHLGYNFASGLFVDLEGGDYSWVMRTTGSNISLDMQLFSAGLGYNVPLTKRVQAYGVAGLGVIKWDTDAFPAETDLQINYGVGARVSLTNWLALRGEARMHQVPNALAATSDAFTGATLADETFWGWGFTIGASIFPKSGAKDADGDGVSDGQDACPNTPMGVRVDARGCALDSDRDGVADHLDRCPSTPAGARVDANGCPTDADGDGVFDGLDRCPATPAGARVDASGCPTDGDRDGVFDGLDRCPNTRTGARVDSNGCALDGDRDGVPDGIDQCPDTAAGSPVDATGCPVSAIERDIEAGSYNFDAVNFAHDSSVLRPAATPILQEVGRVLVARNNQNVRLTGHTDSQGTEIYNQALSVRRATAVRDYLRTNFPALNSARFELVGAGELQPVADNSTAAGRAQNRRVEIVIVN